jgi:hypothetical protein
MKRDYSKKMYHQRSKVETIFYVIKKTMGDDIMSIKTKAQNNEIRFKIIAYNAARIVSLAYSLFVGFLQGLYMTNLKYLTLFHNPSSAIPKTIFQQRWFHVGLSFP